MDQYAIECFKIALNCKNFLNSDITYRDGNFVHMVSVKRELIVLSKCKGYDVIAVIYEYNRAS